MLRDDEEHLEVPIAHFLVSNSRSKELKYDGRNPKRIEESKFEPEMTDAIERK